MSVKFFKNFYLASEKKMIEASCKRNNFIIVYPDNLFYNDTFSKFKEEVRKYIDKDKFVIFFDNTSIVNYNIFNDDNEKIYIEKLDTNNFIETIFKLISHEKVAYIFIKEGFLNLNIFKQLYNNYIPFNYLILKEENKNRYNFDFNDRLTCDILSMLERGNYDYDSSTFDYDNLKFLILDGSDEYYRNNFFQYLLSLENAYYFN